MVSFKKYCLARAEAGVEILSPYLTKQMLAAANVSAVRLMVQNIPSDAMQGIRVDSTRKRTAELPVSKPRANAAPCGFERFLFSSRSSSFGAVAEKVIWWHGFANFFFCFLVGPYYVKPLGGCFSWMRSEGFPFMCSLDRNRPHMFAVMRNRHAIGESSWDFSWMEHVSLCAAIAKCMKMMSRKKGDAFHCAGFCESDTFVSWLHGHLHFQWCFRGVESRNALEVHDAEILHKRSYNILIQELRKDPEEDILTHLNTKILQKRSYSIQIQDTLARCWLFHTATLSSKKFTPSLFGVSWQDIFF